MCSCLYEFDSAYVQGRPCSRMRQRDNLVLVRVEGTVSFSLETKDKINSFFFEMEGSYICRYVLCDVMGILCVLTMRFAYPSLMFFF